jgi:hypothetical protein
MNLKSISLWVGFGIMVVLLTLLSVIFWMADPFNFRALQDQKLIKFFHDHRETFEKLQQMATEDAKNKWYFSEPLDGQSKLDESRLHEYKNLTSEISPCFSVTTDYDGAMRFIFAEGAAISPGWMKGIEYVPGNLERQGVIKESLDKARTLPPGVYLRQIEPKWYLVYQRTE